MTDDRSNSGRWLPRGWLLPLVVALVVRLAMLVPSVGRVFQGDEPAYRGLASAWADLGAYTGQWPPLHSAMLAGCYRAFGEGGEAAARVVLSLLSVWSCAWLMALAQRAHSESAGRIAGWIGALYLPLLPFAHVLLSEGLAIAVLLPALTLLLAVAQGAATGTRATIALVVAGAFLGLSCLTRETGLFWLVAITAWGLAALREPSQAIAIRRPALVAAVALTVVAPWSARASQSLGTFQLLGRTAGVNAYMGWNADYVNFDLAGLDVPTEGVPVAATRARLLEPPPETAKWQYEFVPHVGERDRLHVQRGAAFAREHPAFFARTRVVKAADLATPLSFMTRFLRMPEGDPSLRGARRSGGYGAPLDATAARVVLSVLALLSVLAVALLGALGSTVVELRRGAASLLVAGFVASSSVALVVAMSRFRAPFEALLLVPAAAAIATLAQSGRWRPGVPPKVALALVLLVLAGLWTLSIPPVVASFRSLL
ncbi:MAG: hypothetical protein AAF957_06295 [Planctomycetota bacterium]